MIKPILNLFFPRLCYACEETVLTGTSQICISCLHQIPRTDLFLHNDPMIEKRFWGRVNFERASSFLYFESQGLVQNLIHQFKYKKRKDLAIFLGEWAASELIPTGFFTGIKGIIPIPIHRKKRKKRGYNQSDLIAEGLSKITEIPWYQQAVCKEIHTETQTRKARFHRWKNVQTSFCLHQNHPLKGEHYLLVDDVMTTGATAEACARELLKIEGLRLSFLSMAIPF